MLNKHESGLKDYRLAEDEEEEKEESDKAVTTTRKKANNNNKSHFVDLDDYHDADDQEQDDEALLGGKKGVNDCKIFIGNLPFTTVKHDLEALFAQVGLQGYVTLYSDSTLI